MRSWQDKIVLFYYIYNNFISLFKGFVFYSKIKFIFTIIFINGFLVVIIYG